MTWKSIVPKFDVFYFICFVMVFCYFDCFLQVEVSGIIPFKLSILVLWDDNTVSWTLPRTVVPLSSRKCPHSRQQHVSHVTFHVELLFLQQTELTLSCFMTGLFCSHLRFQ